MSRPISIISEKDGLEILTDSKSAFGSNLLKTLIEEYGEEKTNKLTIPEIRGEVLILIVKYLEHLKDNPFQEIPKPLKNYNLKEYISEWDYEFLSRYDNKIYDLIELINAADYLDIRPLLEMTSAKAATMVKDYDKEKFIEVFQIEQDLTDEDLKLKEAEFEKEREIKRQKIRELELEKETMKNNENLNSDL
jgi:S-phase kinase-associated protein 1